jgi:two-component system, LuxR family, sensor kinase FixL
MKPNDIAQGGSDDLNGSIPANSDFGAPVSSTCSDFDVPYAKQLLEALATRSRLADLGERSSALVHELRQPLFSIAMANENLRMMLAHPELPRSQLERAIERIAEQVQRAQTIIDRTLAYASGRSRNESTADLGVAARQAIEFMKPVLEAAEIDVQEHGTDMVATVGMCQIEAEQVFVNILRNAAESIEVRRQEGWQGAPRIAVDMKLECGMVRCEVSDNGAGMTDATAALLFEPFFTTKPQTGTGLGLRICREALERAGGSVRLVAGEGEGARVDLELPLHFPGGSDRG